MEENDLLQSNSDDEVMVRQADGTFQKMKMSDLTVSSNAQRKTPQPLVVQSEKPTVKSMPVKTLEAQAVLPRKLVVSPAPLPLSPSKFVPSIKTSPSTTTPHLFVTTMSATLDFDSQADSLVGRLAANVPEDLKTRVKMLLVSYMKGIRQEYAVRERLLQSVESGGLGWDAVRADLFLKQMKALSGSSENDKTDISQAPEIKEEIKTSSSQVSVAPNLLPEIEPEMHMSKVSESPPQPRMSAQSQTQHARQIPPPKPIHAPPIAIPKPPLLRQSQSAMPQVRIPPKPQQLQKIVAQKSESKKQEPPIVPSVPSFHFPPRTSDGIRVSAPPVLKIVEEKGEKPRVVPHEEALAPQKQPPHVAIPQTPNGKADVKDITYKPRLIGPIDELRTLTLVDFRRLSRDAQVAVDKIHAKVELLGEESFEKKVKGILAWRASEVNQLYAALLNESLTSSKPIKKVFESRASRKEITLTMDEFHAIMNLNRQLRF